MIVSAGEALEIRGLRWRSRFWWARLRTGEQRRKIDRFGQFWV